MWTLFLGGCWGNRTLWILAIVIFMITLVGTPGYIWAQDKPRTVTAITTFDPEDANAGFENAQPPPDAVLAALLTSAKKDQLDDELKGLGIEQKRALFEVVQVNLGRSVGNAYVVHGKPPMIGADCDWFWIVQADGHHARVLLFSNGLALSLRKHSTAGYRDIVVSWASAAFTGERLYGYNGSEYKLIREQTKEQKP